MHGEGGLHACPFCRRCFSRKPSLRDHILSHQSNISLPSTASLRYYIGLLWNPLDFLEIRPHLCESCGKGYSRRSSLFKHIAADHSNVKLTVAGVELASTLWYRDLTHGENLSPHHWLSMVNVLCVFIMRFYSVFLRGAQQLFQKFYKNCCWFGSDKSQDSQLGISSRVLMDCQLYSGTPSGNSQELLKNPWPNHEYYYQIFCYSYLGSSSLVLFFQFHIISTALVFHLSEQL